MIKLNKPLCALLLCITQSVWAQSKLPLCQGEEINKWNNCFGSVIFDSGAKYNGEYKKGIPDGRGTYEPAMGLNTSGNLSQVKNLATA